MWQLNQSARRMDIQTAFNIVLALVAFLGGWG
jgi:hypothetical protein